MRSSTDTTSEPNTSEEKTGGLGETEEEVGEEGEDGEDGEEGESKGEEEKGLAPNSEEDSEEGLDLHGRDLGDTTISQPTIDHE